MRVKVIKEIKGLVPGDILRYNSNEDRYEITKTEYDISDNKESTNSIKFSISSYIIEDFKDYFIYLDEEDNEIQINKIYYEDFPESKIKTSEEVQPEVKNESIENSEVSKLQKQVQELEKKLEDIERFSIKTKQLHVNPFGYYWF